MPSNHIDAASTTGRREKETILTIAKGHPRILPDSFSHEGLCADVDQVKSPHSLRVA